MVNHRRHDYASNVVSHFVLFLFFSCGALSMCYFTFIVVFLMYFVMRK